MWLSLTVIQRVGCILSYLYHTPSLVTKKMSVSQPTPLELQSKPAHRMFLTRPPHFFRRPFTHQQVHSAPLDLLLPQTLLTHLMDVDGSLSEAGYLVATLEAAVAFITQVYIYIYMRRGKHVCSVFFVCCVVLYERYRCVCVCACVCVLTFALMIKAQIHVFALHFFL